MRTASRVTRLNSHLNVSHSSHHTGENAYEQASHLANEINSVPITNVSYPASGYYSIARRSFLRSYNKDKVNTTGPKGLQVEVRAPRHPVVCKR